ncbi:MAG: hypothetical protein AAF226_17350, partial [Verrucomicrobiota bacterium]
GTGASFFGSRASGRRFLFILDHSSSMSEEQLALRNGELQRSLETLPPGVQYQVILFAGACLFAEPKWTHDNTGQTRLITVSDARGRDYQFKSIRGANEWDFDGEDKQMPKANWLRAGPQSFKKTMRAVETVKPFFGTDWGLALKMGTLMKPAPDVIFFMSDGSGGNAPRSILAFNKANGNPRINTFAMQTPDGARQFNEIAEGSGGTFVIVTKDGSTIKGADFLADEAKYRKLLY